MFRTICAFFQLITKCVTSRVSDAWQLTKVSDCSCNVMI